MKARPTTEKPRIDIAPSTKGRYRVAIDHFLHLLEERPADAAHAVKDFDEVGELYQAAGTMKGGRHTYEGQIVQSTCSMMAAELVTQLMVDNDTRAIMEQARRAYSERIGRRGPKEESDFIALKALMLHVASYKG